MEVTTGIDRSGKCTPHGEEGATPSLSQWKVQVPEQGRHDRLNEEGTTPTETKGNPLHFAYSGRRDPEHIIRESTTEIS